MDNYKAIMKMNRQQLEDFLDGVYCTGLNNGMFASRLPDDAVIEALENNPFDRKWLSDNAEKAVLQDEANEDEKYLLDALVAAVFRNAGIDEYESDSDMNNNTVVF